MQVKTISSTPTRGSAEFAQLREAVTGKWEITMIAAALAASDLGQRGFLPFEDAVDFAVQGLARLGGVDEGCRRSAWILSLINTDVRLSDAGVLSSDPKRRRITRTLAEARGTSVRRWSFCSDVAWRLAENGNSPAGRAGRPEYTPVATTARPALRSRVGDVIAFPRRIAVRAA